jgi:hypothetical protein
MVTGLTGYVWAFAFRAGVDTATTPARKCLRENCIISSQEVIVAQFEAPSWVRMDELLDLYAGALDNRRPLRDLGLLKFRQRFG